MKKELKKLNHLLDIAVGHENSACYEEAIKAHKRSVLLIQHLVNNHFSSKTIQKKLISTAINSIKQTEILENILLHLKNAKLLHISSEIPQVSNKNVKQLLEDYFLSPHGQHHTDEQKKSIENISKICNISKSTTSLKNVAGMHGNIFIIDCFHTEGFLSMRPLTFLFELSQIIIHVIQSLLKYIFTISQDHYKL